MSRRPALVNVLASDEAQDIADANSVEPTLSATLCSTTWRADMVPYQVRHLLWMHPGRRTAMVHLLPQHARDDGEEGLVSFTSGVDHEYYYYYYYCYYYSLLSLLHYHNNSFILLLDY